MIRNPFSSLPLTQHGFGPRLLQQLLDVGRRNPFGGGRRDLVDDALLEQFVEHQIVLQRLSDGLVDTAGCGRPARARERGVCSIYIYIYIKKTPMVH